MEPLTFSIVRPISKIGSTAKIGEMDPKNPPIPVPDKDTEAAIVAVPGTPAIPKEPIAMTITLITYIVKSSGTSETRAI